MTRKKIDTLIVDLDNTLFDWLALWHDSFVVTYREVAAMLGDGEAAAAIRRIHQGKRTSEYRFLVDELLADRSSEAAQICARIELLLNKSGLQRSAEPYDGVRESLATIKSAGTKIVACTESMEFYTINRLRTLGLEGLIDELFCNKDHSMPQRRSTSESGEQVATFKSPRIHHIGPGLSKPDPRVLSELLDVTGVEPERAAYVGDSIARDVLMAQKAGVIDIHAKYGETNGRPEFELLSRVSHWTDADILRESVASGEAGRLEPSITLRSSFAEIFGFIEFEKFGASAINEAREPATSKQHSVNP